MAANLWHDSRADLPDDLSAARPLGVSPPSDAGVVDCRRARSDHAATGLALQLPFCFEVRALSNRLVSSTPERPCDDVCGLNPLSSESDGDAADFLD